MSVTRRPVPDWSEMYVDDDRRYVYCLVSKASCTSWKRTLLWMTGKVPSRYSNMYEMPVGYIHNYIYNDRVMSRLVNLDEPEVDRRLSGADYYKFVFVREPLDRLVSAYRDKILADPTYRMDKQILALQRRSGHAADDSAKSLVNLLGVISLSHSPQLAGTNKSATGKVVSTDARPTFAEFVTFILAQRAVGRRLDRHWRPQSELCSPCVVNYDFVGHQETLHEDAEYVLNVLRRRTTSKPLPSNYTDVRFPDSDETRGYDEAQLRQRNLERQDKTARVVDEMLAQLSDDALRRIVDLYDDDYELFGFERPARLLSLTEVRRVAEDLREAA